MNTDGLGLIKIQNWMQTVIAHPGVHEGVNSREARQHIDVNTENLEKVLTRSRALPALDRLAIYGSAYFGRLIECLREEFPVLKHALGEELFDAFAVDYLGVYPSRSYTLFRLASNFPRFLAETRPDQEGDGRSAPNWPDFLIDLAMLELTFNEVFDGVGMENEHRLDADELRAISPERVAETRLLCAPCLRLLALRYPVHKYFTAVRRHEDPDLPAPVDTWLAVSRRRYVVRHYELSQPASQLLQAILAGESLGQAINQAVEAAGSDIERLQDNLWTWFHDWAAEGFFRAVESADATTARPSAPHKSHSANPPP
jgi:hypothetical protein